MSSEIHIYIYIYTCSALGLIVHAGFTSCARAGSIEASDKHEPQTTAKTSLPWELSHGISATCLRIVLFETYMEAVSVFCIFVRL